MHLFLALYAVWVVCSARTEPFFLISGLIACAVTMWFVRRMGAYDRRHFPFYFRPRAWRYTLWLLKEIVISGVDVTRIVLQRKLAISPAIGWIKASQHTEIGRVTYANSITLTPGTVSVDVEEGRLRVHALDKGIFHTLMEEIMDKKVTKEVEKR